jgi:hypothetical protein
VQRLLSTRENAFRDYAQHALDSTRSEHFMMQSCVKIENIQRCLCLMRRG